MFSTAPLVPRPMPRSFRRGYGSFLGKLPSAQLAPFRGARHTLQIMADKALGDRGEKSALVRHFTTWVIADVWPKDYLGEIITIRNVFVQPSPSRPGTPLFRYTNDPLHIEFLKDPQRMVEEILEHGTSAIDCDEYVCMMAAMLMQIGRRVELVALGFAPDSLTHVGVRAQDPKSKAWIWMDAVAGPREREAARRAQEILVWSLD